MKTKMKRILILALTSTLFSISALAATPTISSVSGTVSTGQTLTITGVSMVNENSSAWRKNYGNTGPVLDEAYFNGCSGSLTGGGAANCAGWRFSNSGTSNTASFDTSNYIVGSASVKINETTNCGSVTSCGDAALQHYEAIDLPANFCAAAYVKYKGTFAAYYQKFYLTIGGPNQFYVNAGVNGDGTASGFLLKDGGWGMYSNGNTAWTPDSWHYFEICIDTTSYSGDRFTTWWDGVQNPPYTFEGHSGAKPMYNLLGIPNWSSATSVPFYMWIDRYIHSPSRIYPASVIEVSGDGSTWKYQEPVKLSDTSIQFKLNLSGVTGTNYRLRVTNNRQETSAIYTLSGGDGGGGDTQAPSVPASLAASVISSSQINLSWSASTDNVGVTGYKIYRGGTLLTTTTSRTYNNTGLAASTAYSYRVTAIDAAGNESSQCTAVSATTQTAQVTDTTKPSVPAGLSASVISSSQINLSWSASTDNVGVNGYKIYRGGTLLTTTTSRTYNNTGLAASTAYSYRVSAIDAAGNESSQCTAVSATTQAAQVMDTTKPSVPTGLAASVISSSQINLSWSASTDNVGVTGYKIYRGGTLLTTTTSRTHNDTGLLASTAYSYRVSAIDAAGNESSQCTAVSATTQAGSSAGATLFQENFDNNSLESRGWYDFGGQAAVVSGGQSGNCLQWAWAQGASSPTNTGTMRKLFTATDSLYVSFYIKFQSGWRGSQKAYHPHMILIPSNLDSEYTPLANNYLNTYIEFVSDVGSPYSIRPLIAIQDEKRVNTSNGTPPNNLTAITENRSVAYCNTPVSSGASGTCYADNPYYSANTWKASSASVSTNVWHHVEVYFKMNTISGGKGLSNGIMQKWVDGALVINKSDVLYRTNQDATKKWAQFVLAPYIGDGSPIAQSMWIDELTVGTSSPNNVAPKAPTGFSVK